ncbi:MAG: hypothetical protein HZB26_12460 [Candidatus Hydrogenedentes bacterium]|nr:hypothetical protein [Candidatus Hydrogenedentota bacterium]
MRNGLRSCALALLVSATAFAGQMVNGVLMVDGKPFYPLGSWNFDYTTPDDIARLGMNTSFRGGPNTDAAVEQFRTFMRDCAARNIQVTPYLSYGGDGVVPWPPDAVRAIAKLASEPNLLAWYVGDDIGMPHLPGIEQTVNLLRKDTPTIPTVADYIADKTPEAKTTFTKFVDIRCQYSYPIPNEPFSKYLSFFDQQRQFVGDPLWTWVQTFMWGGTGRKFDVGAEGPGPVPDPEQVRLLSFAAINRGVRGLLFFPHHELHRQPELAAEVALTCHEIRLVSDFLASGTTTLNLVTNVPDVNAAAFTYGESEVVSVALFKPAYHRWVDEAVIKNLTIECPWPGERLPQAMLVATPDVTTCVVERGANPKTIRITLPSLELAGFVLVTCDQGQIDALRKGVDAIPAQIARLIVPAASVQARKTAEVVWQLGLDNLYDPSIVMDSMRAVERCADAVNQGKSADAVRAWRDALRASRNEIGTVMKFAEARRDRVPANLRLFLESPYGLRNIHGLASVPASDDPWRFVDRWMIAGPFPLEWDGVKSPTPPAGFVKAYPPEKQRSRATTFKTVDGSSGWMPATSDLSGLLDFSSHFTTTDNVVCYARCRIIAPRTMEAKLSLGSNDGARVWINGKNVFSWSGTATGGRPAKPHQNEIPVQLTKGPNSVLVKVENLGKDWQLYLSAHDPAGELKFDT